MGKDSAGRPASASAARTICDLLGEPRGGRRPGAEEPVAPADRAAQRGLAGRAEPERRVGLLERLGLHRLVLELPELPVEGDAGLRPQRLHQRDALGEPRDVPLAGPRRRRRTACPGRRYPRRPRSGPGSAGPACSGSWPGAPGCTAWTRTPRSPAAAARCTPPRRSLSRSARAGSTSRAAAPASTRCRSPAPRPGSGRPGTPPGRTRRRRRTAGWRSRTSRATAYRAGPRRLRTGKPSASLRGAGSRRTASRVWCSG